MDARQCPGQAPCFQYSSKPQTTQYTKSILLLYPLYRGWNRHFKKLASPESPNQKWMPESLQNMLLQKKKKKIDWILFEGQI